MVTLAAMEVQVVVSWMTLMVMEVPMEVMVVPGVALAVIMASMVVQAVVPMVVAPGVALAITMMAKVVPVVGLELTLEVVHLALASGVELVLALALALALALEVISAVVLESTAMVVMKDQLGNAIPGQSNVVSGHRQVHILHDSLYDRSICVFRTVPRGQEGA